MNKVRNILVIGDLYGETTITPFLMSLLLFWSDEEDWFVRSFRREDVLQRYVLVAVFLSDVVIYIRSGAC